MRDDRTERLLRGLAPARPTANLRARVLAAVAGAAPAAPVSRVEQMWFSRRFRLGWAAAVIALVALQVVTDRALADRLEEAFTVRRAAVERPWSELAGEISLPLDWMQDRTSIDFRGMREPRDGVDADTADAPEGTS